MMNKGRLIVISAPSGAGKGTVIKKLLELRGGFKLSVSATTRAPRVGEIDGVSYFFVSKEKFLEMIAHGELLEYAEYVGEYYGTPKKPVEELLDNGEDVILEIEVQGAKRVMAMQPGAISIFIVPPDMKELERRLRARKTDTEEKLTARLAKAQLELPEKNSYGHIVVNDDVSRAAREILTILDSHKERI